MSFVNDAAFYAGTIVTRRDETKGLGRATAGRAIERGRR